MLEVRLHHPVLMMKELRKEIQVRDKTFVFRGSITGREEIYYGDSCVSSKRSLFGGKHEFELDGSHYVIKVKASFTVQFRVDVDGITIIEPNSNLPYWLAYSGGSIASSAFYQLSKSGYDPRVLALTLLLIFIGGILFLVGTCLVLDSE